MAHTYTNLIYHVVFSTEGHIRSLTKERRAELFAYLAALIKEKKGLPLIINGVEDHVHLLFELPPSVALSDVMRFLKANSSRWFKERFEIPFAWQTGFGAFSVSRSVVPKVSDYIRDQEEHHKKRGFRAEFIALLNKSGVDIDEDDLWK
ncbi:MAG: IS200/IS605 family transposase [Chloracidobacterium sp.]|nr:IS200/IS605 family transposase [Chloracidobacterium sp.]MCO5332981.1 IS200/IS605 family transposase [Pyrinomonadaceae bacterium]